MIAFDLTCSADHMFEGWFDNAQSFEEQLEKGLVSCPVCGTTDVTRKLSTFGIARHRHQEQKPRKQEAQEAMKQIVEYFEHNFENVGADFAKEALKMHYGVAEHRNIRGVSSQKEEDMLKDEGIDFLKVPIPVSSAPEEE